MLSIYITRFYQLCDIEHNILSLHLFNVMYIFQHFEMNYIVPFKHKTSNQQHKKIFLSSNRFFCLHHVELICPCIPWKICVLCTLSLILRINELKYVFYVHNLNN